MVTFHWIRMARTTLHVDMNPVREKEGGRGWSGKERREKGSERE